MNLRANLRQRRVVLGIALVAVALVVAMAAVFALAGGDEENAPMTALQPTLSPPAFPTVEAIATATAVAQDTETPAPEATATRQPAAASPPVATAAATATASSPSSPPPTEAPQVNLCAGTLQAAIDGAEAGAVLDLRACTFEGTAKVTKALTLVGGTLISPSQNRQAISLSIDSNNVTVDGWTFQGGGNVISIIGRSNVRVLNSTFRNHTGGVIALWGAVQGIEIAGNDIVNSLTTKVGIVGGRASEGSNPCPTVGRNVTIRNNYGDQGSGAIGWFGIELKCFEDVLIEGNRLRGGSVLISLPDSNRVTIRSNTLDLTGSPYWGVEVPKANNVTIEYNTVFGDGPMGDTAFSANSGSQGLIVRFNVVQNVKTLVDGPLGAIVTDNCLYSVTSISEHGVPESSTIERNAVC